MGEPEDRLRRLESEIERRLVERFAGLRDEFDRLRVESDRRWEGFLGRFDQDFRGIVPPELLVPPEPPPDAESKAPPERPEGSGLLSIEIARNLDDAGNQVEALHRFLDLCLRHASRAALLVAKSGSLVVWKATGFTEHGGSDESARRVALPLDGTPLARVIEGSAFRLAEGNDVSRRLGAADASAAVLVPIAVREKVSGAVYADCTADEAGRFDPESIAFLTFLAGLFVDRLAGRKLKPAPALRRLDTLDTGESAQLREAEAPSSSVEASSAEPAASGETPLRSGPRDSFGTQMLKVGPPTTFESAAPPSPPPSTESEPAAEAEAEPSEAALEPESDRGEPEPSLAYEEEPAPARRAPEFRDGTAPASEPELSVGAEPSSEPEFSSEPELSRQPEPAPPPPAPATLEPRPSKPLARPSAGARRLAGPLAPLEGDERREEARRFAKLLVSEIKLYNEKAVLEGRQHGDLYGRLKEDIDRSRQMYDERIPEDVRSSSNFFYEELVRILAEGRSEALGI